MRVAKVFGSNTWSGWYFVDLESTDVRNVFANCSSPIFASFALASASCRKRVKDWRRAKAARLMWKMCRFELRKLAGCCDVACCWMWWLRCRRTLLRSAKEEHLLSGLLYTGSRLHMVPTWFEEAYPASSRIDIEVGLRRNSKCAFSLTPQEKFLSVTLHPCRQHTSQNGSR